MNTLTYGLLIIVLLLAAAFFWLRLRQMGRFYRRMQSLSQENYHLRQSLAYAETANAELSQAHKALQNSMSAAEAYMGQMQHTMAQLQATQRQLEADLHQAQAQMVPLQQQLEALTQERQQLLADLQNQAKPDAAAGDAPPVPMVAASIVTRPPLPTYDVRQLQADLAELGFGLVGRADGIAGRRTRWALREFQSYAKMKYLAQETPGQAARYVDRLAQVANPEPSRYAGPVSGQVNAETLEAVQHWKQNRWRCPVVVEAWTMAAGQRSQLLAENIWLHDQVPNSAPRMYARDFSHYYPIPLNQDPDDLMVLGDYVTYLQWSGPRSVPPSHTWPDAELLPQPLLGSRLGALSKTQRSTYKVVRVVSEVECLGFFDSVNAYDNAFVSLGPCHWTLGIVDSNGAVTEGELGGYLAYLCHSNPDTFNRAIAHFGIQIDKSWGKDGSALFNASQRKYTSWVALQQEDGSYARLPLAEPEGNYFKTWHWFYRFVMAGRTLPGFREGIWDMTRLRLRDILATPWGEAVQGQIDGDRGPLTVGDIYTSEQAIALLLRWHIRFPAHIISDGQAGSRLRQAFRRTPIPPTAGTPKQWNDAHEAALINGLMAEVASLNNSGFSETIQYVRKWPAWLDSSANRRRYQLTPDIGPLDTGRGSFRFDPSHLPPAPMTR